MLVVFPSRSSRTITIVLYYIHLAYEPQDIYPYFSHESFRIGSLFHETDHPSSISSTTLLSAPNHPPCCMPNVHSYIRVLQAKSIPSKLRNDFTKPTTNQPIGHSRAAETDPKSPDHDRRQRLSARIATTDPILHCTIWIENWGTYYCMPPSPHRRPSHTAPISIVAFVVLCCDESTANPQ
jgi:hypothetical protein